MRILITIKLEYEKVKIRLSIDKLVIHFIEKKYRDDYFKLKINSDKLEELSKDLWNEYLNKVKEIIENSKLKKN